MTVENSYLALYLDAPLQSWGYKSQFDYRTSASFPTHSAVIGMVCAALGIDRSDKTSLAKLARPKMAVYLFNHAQRLVDYHTVGGGWDKKKHRQQIVSKADGNPGNTVVTYREYLMDAKFGLLLQAPPDKLNEWAEALRYPKWGVWLGRKSCIPASPIVQGVFDNQEDAVNRLSVVAGKPPYRAIVEVEDFDEGTDTLQDLPLDFSEREFAPRRIATLGKDDI